MQADERSKLDDLRREVDGMAESVHQSRSDRWWMFAGRAALVLLVPLLVAAMSWHAAMQNRVRDNSERITVIERTMFTAEHARAMEQRILAWLEAHNPPKWLGDAVMRLDRATRDFTTKVEKLNARLHAIEAKLENRDR